MFFNKLIKSKNQQSSDSAQKINYKNQNIRISYFYRTLSGKYIRVNSDPETATLVDNVATKALLELLAAGNGNLKYEYFFPMDDSETVLLIDSWENQEAIDEHHKTPMIIRKQLKNNVFYCIVILIAIKLTEIKLI